MRIWTSFALVAAVFAASPAAAQVTYEYQGNDYDVATGPPYDTTMSLSGSFVLSSPLPPNTMTDASGILVSFSFFDGVSTRTQADSTVCEFDLTTDAAGDIQYWHIRVVQTTPPPGGQQNLMESLNRPLPSAVVDQAGLLVTPTGCGSGSLDPFGGNDFDPGTFVITAIVEPVPTMSEIGLALLALLLVGAGVWRLRG